MNTQQCTIRWRFLSHFRGQNIGFHGIARQLVRIRDGESPSPAFLVQEGIGGLGTLRTRLWLFTFAESVNRTPILFPAGWKAIIKLLTKILSNKRIIRDVLLAAQGRQVKFSFSSGGKSNTFSSTAASQIQTDPIK